MYGSLQISVNYIVIFIDQKKYIVIFDFEIIPTRSNLFPNLSFD